MSGLTSHQVFIHWIWRITLYSISLGLIIVEAASDQEVSKNLNMKINWKH